MDNALCRNGAWRTVIIMMTTIMMLMMMAIMIIYIIHIDRPREDVFAYINLMGVTSPSERAVPAGLEGLSQILSVL